jgi:hypothetical protein
MGYRSNGRGFSWLTLRYSLLMVSSVELIGWDSHVTMGDKEEHVCFRASCWESSEVQDMR